MCHAALLAAKPEHKLNRMKAIGLPANSIVPGHPQYETARRVWNGTIDRRPAAIVPCATAEEVAATVRLAADEKLPLAVRGGGHSLPGFSTCEGGIVLDLSRMRTVEVDPVARIARVGGGTRWRDVDLATEQFALGTTGGLVSTMAAYWQGA